MSKQSSDNFLENRLKSLLGIYQKILFIGLGNPIKGDDGVGVHISETLNKFRKRSQVEIITCYNSPANYLGKIVAKDPDFIIFIDSIFHPDFLNKNLEQYHQHLILP